MHVSNVLTEFYDFCALWTNAYFNRHDQCADSTAPPLLTTPCVAHVPPISASGNLAANRTPRVSVAA